MRRRVLTTGARASHRPLLSADDALNIYCRVLNAAAASAYRFTMLATSVAGGLFLARVPLLGHPAAVIFLCWVDAYVEHAVE